MQQEYEAIAQAGLVLQLDCPDLAMGRHIQFTDASLDEFRRQARLNVEALDYATRNIDPDQMRMHLRWGNYEGPHHKDVPLRDIIDIVRAARPNAISLEAGNPRHAHEWQVFEDVKLPDGKLLIPGVIDSTNNYLEHPVLVAQRLTNWWTGRRRRPCSRRWWSCSRRRASSAALQARERGVRRPHPSGTGAGMLR